MGKATRILQTMHYLRSNPAPIKAQDMANDMGVSLRTIYRDIESLRAAGAIIDGEAGFGYSLIEDTALPPMMFNHDEIEALVLGLREVQAIADPVLVKAAQDAMTKLKASLPNSMQHHLEHASLHAKRFQPRPKITIDVTALRREIKNEVMIEITYADKNAKNTKRTIKPLSIVFMETALMVLAWCELRNDYRAFRVDRISSVAITDKSFRPNRVPLLREYLKQLNAELKNNGLSEV